MKKEYDNLPEEDKKKRIMNMLVENQKSDAKNFKNLMDDMNKSFSSQTHSKSNSQ